MKYSVNPGIQDGGYLATYCYRYMEQPRSWYNSYRRCREGGGYLAVISDNDLLSELTKYLNRWQDKVKLSAGINRVVDTTYGAWIGHNSHHWAWHNGKI